MVLEKGVDQKATIFPPGWKFIANEKDAQKFLSDLVDSPTDLFRVRSSLSASDLNKLMSRCYSIDPKKSGVDVNSVLAPFLSNRQKDLLKTFPPYFIIVPKELYESLGKATKGSNTGALATYNDVHPDLIGLMLGFKSNVVFLREDYFQEFRFNPNTMRTLLSHESLHYISEASRPGGVEVPHFINEGITEYLALLGSLRSGESIVKNSGIYPIETMTAYVLSKVAGEDELTKAYFSGDFSRIRATVDRLGGFGSWETLTAPIDYKNTNDTKERRALLRSLLAKKSDFTTLAEAASILGK